eukprot:gnl/Hemi2/14592_TR4950_c0_g1_i1.p1 gnl/Hemi2/14592_TR4950_c0_g1~~gnl/Hemi2/14592_TR4950_c0_g1_i1.p1  ORF type:complete len:544 (-),score=87.68 gnl/Hemi2/14592_TR4950_c0_g1_i1:167-1798(-)
MALWRSNDAGDGFVHTADCPTTADRKHVPDLRASGVLCLKCFATSLKPGAAVTTTADSDLVAVVARHEAAMAQLAEAMAELKIRCEAEMAQVTESMAELKLRQQKSVQHHGSVTHAEFANSIQFETLESNQLPWKLASRNIPRTSFKDPPTAKEEHRYQAYFCLEANNLGGNALHLVDTHTRHYLGGLAPDASFIPRSLNVVTDFCVRFHGELKPLHDHASFTAAAVGQTVNSATTLLELNPWRPFAVVFLSDCHSIQFFVVRRCESGFRFQRTQLLPLAGDGFRALVGLLDLPAAEADEALGYQLPVIPGYTITGFLGQGATSCVYQVGDNHAAKLPAPAFAHLLAKEACCLMSLKDTACVPRLVGHIDTGIATGLVLSPVCRPCQPTDLTASLVQQAVMVVRAAHDKGFAHRDLRPTNLMVHDGNLVVIDWGASVETDWPAEYHGTLHYASDRVLECLASGQLVAVARADDLHSLVRCFFALLFPHLPPPSGGKSRSVEICDTRAFWRRHLQPPFWKKCEAAADACDYDRLVKVVSRLVHV